jgi:hypothetical protein
MPNNSQHLPVAEESLKRKHEARTPHLRNPLIIGASVAFMIVFSLATAGTMFYAFSRNRPLQHMRPLGLISAPDLRPLARFPEPNLQIDDDHAEMTALLAGQNQKLNSYGWINRSNGVIHIPIDRAMDLLAQRGLPARTNGISSTDGSPLQLIQERSGQ